MAAANTVYDKSRFTGTAAAGGGTFTADYPVPTDRACRIRAKVSMTAQTGAPAHLTLYSSFECQYEVRNNNGTLVAPAAIAGSANPKNSGGLLANDSQADDFAGGGPATGNWTISTTNMRLTVTNNNVTTAADVCVTMEVEITG